MSFAAPVPSALARGGSAALLSVDLHRGRYPAVCAARYTLQFARGHLQDGFAGAKIFEHKTAFESPSSDVSHLPFGCNSFIELPPLDLTQCPHFMLTVFAIKQLVIAARNTA